MHSRLVALAAATVASFTGLFFAAPAQAADSSLLDQINVLPVAEEHNEGYDRSLFKHWIDADGDGCDTREEVLLEEAIVAPTVGPGCELTGGKWYSYYDGKTWTDKSDVDIDHLVPLAEAWGSGAWAWSAQQRQDFANDLGDPRSLVAVTDNVNASKGERDPAEWLPDLEVCRYISEWVAVKTRWKLSIDQAEKAALVAKAQECEPDSEPTTPPTTEPTTEPTSEPTGGPTTSPTSEPTGTPTNEPTEQASTTPSSSASPASGGGLPVTGAPLAAVAIGALLLLAAGAGLLLMARRRRVRFTI